MKVGYTEFSFGYAFTENLIRGSATVPTGAPVFPNLVQEATLGYDVPIGFPSFIFLFKRKPSKMLATAVAQSPLVPWPKLDVCNCPCR